jgi:hypothetical protein
VRRPQKPFTVEVKKVRKGGFARFLGSGPQWNESDLAEEAPKEQPAPSRATPPRAEPAPPPRRILEAIEPLSGSVPDDKAAEASETSLEPVGQIEAKPRRRGRPPKAAPIADGAETAVARKVRAAPAPRKKRSAPAPSKKPSAPAPNKKSRAPAQNKKSRATESGPQIEIALPIAAPPAPVSTPALAPAPAARVAQSHRVEAASGLPRGERWKRRLPKVLW